MEANAPSGGPRLLEIVRSAIRARQLSRRTEEAYTGWIRRYVRFWGMRHPGELDGRDVERFLSHLANDHDVSTSTQNQAASALLFLYREVLHTKLEIPPDVVRPKKPRRLPVVMTRAEIVGVFPELSGTYRLIAALLYGAGLRLMEGLELRVKDVELERREIIVREGKGGYDRKVMLPEAARAELGRQLGRVRELHDRDVQRGTGWVELPGAFARKSPGAARELAWQWLFPALRHYTDAATGQRRRHHLHESAVQREVRAAVRRAGIPKRATCHTFRHSFATHLLEDGCNPEHVRILMGHKSLRTTMQYLHVLNEGRSVIRSPLDRLDFRI
jgi:integron integrase